jgi:hypothetical protein
MVNVEITKAMLFIEGTILVRIVPQCFNIVDLPLNWENLPVITEYPYS